MELHPQQLIFIMGNNFSPVKVWHDLCCATVKYEFAMQTHIYPRDDRHAHTHTLDYVYSGVRWVAASMSNCMPNLPPFQLNDKLITCQNGTRPFSDKRKLFHENDYRNFCRRISTACFDVNSNSQSRNVINWKNN